MPSFLLFDTSGVIRQKLFVSPDQAAPANVAANTSPGMSALATSSMAPAWSHPNRFKVISGQVTEKNIVTLTASATTFAADGTTSVSLTFSNLNASASVQVGGQAVTVSPTDNVITLTADAPKQFTIQLIDANQWSNALTVEAI